MITFTYRELRKAWSDNLAAANVSSRINPHRLLLFYAVECGLKAAVLKRQAKDNTDGCSDIFECQHDINKLLDRLSAGNSMKLKPAEIDMMNIRINGNNSTRKCKQGQLNQLWRYGGVAVSPTDEDLSLQLHKIALWVAGELR